MLNWLNFTSDGYDYDFGRYCRGKCKDICPERGIVYIDVYGWQDEITVARIRQISLEADNLNYYLINNKEACLTNGLSEKSDPRILRPDLANPYEGLSVGRAVEIKYDGNRVLLSKCKNCFEKLPQIVIATNTLGEISLEELLGHVIAGLNQEQSL